MNNTLIEILKNIELLNNEELEKVRTWVEFNLSKRKDLNQS